MEVHYYREGDSLQTMCELLTSAGYDLTVVDDRGGEFGFVYAIHQAVR
jgi:hypothetical protein